MFAIWIMIKKDDTMVNIAAGQSGSCWFGVAWEGESYVATAIGSTRETALKCVMQCVPEGVNVRFPDQPSAFFDDTVQMLGQLERGDESNKRYVVSGEYRSDSVRAILTAAAAIPMGFVTTYGNIARVSGSEARLVGRVMSTNPLYPIVPCHRVVGADMSLVGYGGKRSEEALEAKLERLAAEARGVPHTQKISLSDGLLTVYPVERVICVARQRRERRDRRTEREDADRLQYRLF
jgi:O-6-methylguanine DNA methyltransferase